MVPYSTREGSGNMTAGDVEAAASGPGTTCGTQSEVGQFLYLEGHEYLM
jgi:hypothetical protein